MVPVQRLRSGGVRARPLRPLQSLIHPAGVIREYASERKIMAAPNPTREISRQIDAAQHEVAATLRAVYKRAGFA